MKFKKINIFLLCIAFIASLISGCNTNENYSQPKESTPSYSQSSAVTQDNIPPFDNEPYVAINNNIPDFNEEELKTESYEFYSELDSLGRCGMTIACIGLDIMPTDERGSIGQVKPSGWQTVKYDNVDGKYLYNRCHLIGYQLTGENANRKNLITGTRYLNIEGMLPFENMVADYVKETGNHVLYRVTPVFDGNNLVARGVQLEGKSVEDNGEGICFNVYAYNNQPDIVIDYSTGESYLKENSQNNSEVTSANDNVTYILNTNSKKIHLITCEFGKSTKAKNKKEYVGNINDLISQGYTPCKNCNP